MKRGLLWKEWRQNAWIFITLFLLVIGLGQLNTHNTIVQHEKEVRYYHSDQFKTEQKAAPNDARMTADDITTTLQVYDSDTGYTLIISLICSIFMGLKATVFEKNKGGDYIAQAMPYSRTTIIAHKLFWPNVTLLVSFLLYRFTSYLEFRSRINVSFLPSQQDYMLTTISITVLLLACFAFAAMIGTLVGDALVASLVTLALLYSSLLFFSLNFSQIIKSITAYATHQSMEDIEFYHFFETINGRNDWHILLGLILILVFSCSAILFYSKASLENNGLFLMLPKMRLPIILIGSLYTALCLSHIEYAERITTRILLRFGLNFGLIMLISAFIGWLCFYKLKKLRRL